MMRIRFEWDSRKAALNLRKHRLSFQAATAVSTDPLAVIFHDVNHSSYEQREIIIGHSANNRLIIVSFTELAEHTVRIISARPATRKERQDYEKNRSL
jgi:uncharacterized DUF497 family protein